MKKGRTRGSRDREGRKGVWVVEDGRSGVEVCLQECPGGTLLLELFVFIFQVLGPPAIGDG
jgi:hypothetical protein